MHWHRTIGERFSFRRKAQLGDLSVPRKLAFAYNYPDLMTLYSLPCPVSEMVISELYENLDFAIKNAKA